MRRWLSCTVLCLTAGGCGEDPCDLGGPGTICTIAGTGQEAFNGDGHPAAETAFFLPSQMRRGPDGLLYIDDFNNQRLRRIEADGTISTLAGDGFHAGAIEGALALDSPLENPIDFDFLPDGRLAFVSQHDPRILVIAADNTIQRIAGNVEQGVRGDEGDGFPPESALFMQLSAITVAPDGAIYISDELANRVRVIKNGIIDTFAGTGFAGFLGDGGPARSAALHGPTAIAIDGANNVYISDAGNCAIRKITPDGTISTVAGTSLTGFGGDGGPASAAVLDHPDGIAVAADGTLYISDRFNVRIRAVAADGTITTIAGTGTRGLAGDGGPAADADLNYVSRVQIDTDGGLLIADQGNASIRKILAR